jgi:hypothetical protein
MKLHYAVLKYNMWFSNLCEIATISIEKIYCHKRGNILDLLE